jgi:hypothetical protein
MNFNGIDDIRKLGFIGFKKVSELNISTLLIPKIKGVYLVLNPNYQNKTFLEIGSGGHFKGKNPNISFEELNSNWIENSLIVYIGKAGNETGKSTLHSRINQYLKFGQGKNIGHWGGRLIWQLQNSQDLIFCWKPLCDEDPRSFEKHLISSYVTTFAKRPFANLSD